MRCEPSIFVLLFLLSRYSMWIFFASYVRLFAVIVRYFIEVSIRSERGSRIESRFEIQNQHLSDTNGTAFSSDVEHYYSNLQANSQQHIKTIDLVKSWHDDSGIKQSMQQPVRYGVTDCRSTKQQETRDGWLQIDICWVYGLRASLSLLTRARNTSIRSVCSHAERPLSRAVHFLSSIPPSRMIHIGYALWPNRGHIDGLVRARCCITNHVELGALTPGSVTLIDNYHAPTR